MVGEEEERGKQSGGGALFRGIYIVNVLGSFEGYTSSPLYLFNNGSWSNIQTTGTTLVISDRVSCFYEKDRISLKNASSGRYDYETYQVSMRLNSVVDLSNYKYLKIFIKSKETEFNVRLGLSQNSSTTTYSSYVDATVTGYGILNISNVTGSYYIYIHLVPSFSGASSGWHDVEGRTFCSISQILLSNT